MKANFNLLSVSWWTRTVRRITHKLLLGGLFLLAVLGLDFDWGLGDFGLSLLIKHVGNGFKNRGDAYSRWGLGHIDVFALKLVFSVSWNVRRTDTGSARATSTLGNLFPSMKTIMKGW